MSRVTAYRRLRPILPSAVFLALSALVWAAECVGQEVAVIVSADVMEVFAKAESDLATIPFEILTRIYLGEKTNLPGRVRVRSLVVPEDDSAEFQVVLRRIYEGNKSDFDRHWRAQINSGLSLQKPENRSLAAAVAAVGNTKGVLALIDASEVAAKDRKETGSQDPRAKLVGGARSLGIEILGIETRGVVKQPFEAGYPLTAQEITRGK